MMCVAEGLAILCPLPSRNLKAQQFPAEFSQNSCFCWCVYCICGHFYLMFLILNITPLLEWIKSSIFQNRCLRLFDIGVCCTLFYVPCKPKLWDHYWWRQTETCVYFRDLYTFLVQSYSKYYHNFWNVFQMFQIMRLLCYSSWTI